VLLLVAANSVQAYAGVSGKPVAVILQAPQIAGISRNRHLCKPSATTSLLLLLLRQSNRLDIDVSFSTAGGVEIEENWDKVKTITIPTAESITGAAHCLCENAAASVNKQQLQAYTLISTLT
jgi:hypothetical protein